MIAYEASLNGPQKRYPTHVESIWQTDLDELLECKWQPEIKRSTVVERKKPPKVMGPKKRMYA